MRKIAVAVAMVAVLFGACGKNDNPSVDNAGAPAAASINVTTKDFQFADFPATVAVDNLAKLTIKNEGTENHEAAVLKLADPGSPTLIQDRDNNNALYVLMPMRV